MLQPIKSTAQIWIVTRHQYGTSAFNPLTLFAGEPVVVLRNVGRFLRLIKASSPHAITLLVQLVSRFPLYISRKNLGGLLTKISVIRERLAKTY